MVVVFLICGGIDVADIPAFGVGAWQSQRDLRCKRYLIVLILHRLYNWIWGERMNEI